MLPRLTPIFDKWYLTEPALLLAVMAHEMVLNTNMLCPFRCGKGRIEYNPEQIDQLSDSQLESCLKAEAIRIVLKHPYGRQPEECRRDSMALASNLVLADNYDFTEIKLPKPVDFNLPPKKSYEWYAFQIERRAPRRGVSGDGSYRGGKQADIVEHVENGKRRDDLYSQSRKEGNSTTNSKSGDNSLQGQLSNASKGVAIPSAELSLLWEADSMMSCTIDAIIEDIVSSGSSWGSLAGNLVDTIIANTRAKIDYRKTLAGFRASVLSSKRHLTRMRPNRRSGFASMGSIRRFDTNLLVAVDVSGSISKEMLEHFYSVIGKIFKYGIEHIDIVQFDCTLGEVQTFEKAKKRVEILGRGGTSFQPLFDYLQKNSKYDGLIILTDGEAPEPQKPKHLNTKVVWVCEDEKAYQKHKYWMKKTGRCCFVQL